MSILINWFNLNLYFFFWKKTCDIDACLKKKIISAAAVLWRQFKNKLTTVHIKPHKNSPEKLKYTPDEYVSQSVWKEFVKARMTNEFEVIFLYEMNKYIYVYIIHYVIQSYTCLIITFILYFWTYFVN